MVIKPQSDNDRAIRYENEQKYKAYKVAKEAEKKPLISLDKGERNAYRSTFRGIFVVFFALIAFATLIRYLVNPDLPTLTLDWFITVIQSAPSVSFDWLVTSNIHLGDWSFNIGSISINFNELRDAFYYIYSVMIQPIIVICQSIVQLVAFIAWFIGHILMLY